MIRLFDIEGGNLIITENCYAIDWLREIMTVFPSCYMKAYRYIFYMVCPDQELNPYVNMEEINKSEELMRMLQVDVEREFFADDLKIEKAIIECRKLYATPTYEAWMAAKSLLEKLKRSFQIEEITWGGKDATGPALVAAMEKLPKLIQAYNETEMKLSQELRRGRGNQDISEDIDELDD